MESKFLAIIPARYASIRFPSKPTVDILGKSMIQRVYEQVQKSEVFEQIVVATDHPQIAQKVASFGGNYILTDPNCPTGTARCFEAYQQLPKKFDFVVNIQGDEPFIQPQQIQDLALCLQENTQIATLAKKIENSDEIFNPNVVKTVFGQDQQALYFSRNPIPYYRNLEKEKWAEQGVFYKHIGIYGFKAKIFEQIQDISASNLETAESLEQLSWLWAGFRIKIGLTNLESYGIDTPEDIEKVLKIFEKNR